MYSEGPAHWYYSGLTDGNYAHDGEYGMSQGPWIVDFDLLRMHPLECNFGMGMIDAHFYQTPGTKPSDRSAALDRFFAATVAFGHPGYLLPERHAAQRHYKDMKVNEEEFRSYYLIQAIAAKYTVADVTSIRYGAENGHLLSTEEAILSKNCDMMQVVTRYSDGTVTAANGSTNAYLSCVVDGCRINLPPGGIYALSGDRSVRVWLGEREGRKMEFAVSPDYIYINGRGAFTEFPLGSTDGICVRLSLSEGEEEVIPFGATRIELPYAADRIEELDEKRNRIRIVENCRSGGKTVLRPVSGTVSYLIRRKSHR